MRKLLKLVAIGALLTVGPMQAFAVTGPTPSDELQIKNATTGEIVSGGSFLFVDTADGERLVTGTSPFTTGPIPVPLFSSPFLPVLSGNPDAGTFFLVLTEPGDAFSDVVRSVITKDAGHPGQFMFAISFDDAPATFSPPSGIVSTISEATFNGNATLSLGLFGTNVEVMFRSDVDPIPEPEIYAMMGIGLALMGFVARRRKRRAVA